MCKYLRKEGERKPKLSQRSRVLTPFLARNVKRSKYEIGNTYVKYVQFRLKSNLKHKDGKKCNTKL